MTKRPTDVFALSALSVGACSKYIPISVLSPTVAELPLPLTLHRNSSLSHLPTEVYLLSQHVCSRQSYDLITPKSISRKR